MERKLACKWMPVTLRCPIMADTSLAMRPKYRSNNDQVSMKSRVIQLLKPVMSITHQLVISGLAAGTFLTFNYGL